MSTETIPELPSSTVKVVNGKVVEVAVWTLWNLEPFMTCFIRRNEDGTFFSSIGDPEHGGRSCEGSLPEVLEGLHPKIRQEYVTLFGLENPDVDAIRNIGFRRHILIN